MSQSKITALLYGWIVIFGLLLISSIILAVFLRLTSLEETTLSWLTLGIGVASLFIGGLIAGIKGQSNGWMIGILVGLGFTLFTFLVQYLGYKQPFTLYQSLHHLGYIIAALIGGIIGVNTVTVTEE